MSLINMKAFGKSCLAKSSDDVEDLINRYGAYDQEIHTYRVALDTINVELVKFHFHRVQIEDQYRMALYWLESPSIQSAELTRLFIEFIPSLIIYNNDLIIRHHIIYGNVELVMYMLQVEKQVAVSPMEHMLVRQSIDRLDLASYSAEMLAVLVKNEMRNIRNPFVGPRIINGLRYNKRALSALGL
jgi:hypothetical protein